MTLFSEHFGLALRQPGLDFVDIPLDADLAVYVDPFAISVYDDPLSNECNNTIVNFFQAAIDAIRNGKQNIAERMLSNLSEPNETRLGVSSDAPQGRGVSGRQAYKLYHSIASSKAAISGLVNEISECDLFIDGIGRDKISDMTTNIIRKHLIEYTQHQCELHAVPLAHRVPSGKMWDEDRGLWREQYEFLPTYNDTKIILVPKNFVRRTLSLNSQDYLNKHILNYLQAEHLQAGSSLVEVLKNGSRRVTKKALKDAYPCNKNWMASFSEQHPSVLDRYKEEMKRIARKNREAEGEALNGIDERAFASALRDELLNIPTGNDNASKFHSLSIGIIEFLFWPNLTNPKKECEINEGRKRIDIVFDNSATDGFFARMRSFPRAAALKIPFECKNYSKDPANPEIDQLAGRFAANRGNLGFLLYRSTSNYDLLVKRCRDSATERGHFMLPLGDKQIFALLEHVEAGNRSAVEQEIADLFNRLIY